MFDMVNKKTKDVLKKIVKRLKNKNISWVVAGGTNLALHGMKVKPKDIDLFTTKEGAFKIYENFWEMYLVINKILREGCWRKRKNKYII